MEMKVFTIRDTKAGMYNTPFYAHTHGEAERSFRELAMDEKSLVSKYPEDYDLYYVGTFNSVTGKSTLEDAPQHVIKAVQLITPKQ